MKYWAILLCLFCLCGCLNSDIQSYQTEPIDEAAIVIETSLQLPEIKLVINNVDLVANSESSFVLVASVSFVNIANDAYIINPFLDEKLESLRWNNLGFLIKLSENDVSIWDSSYEPYSHIVYDSPNWQYSKKDFVLLPMGSQLDYIFEVPITTTNFSTFLNKQVELIMYYYNFEYAPALTSKTWVGSIETNQIITFIPDSP